FAHRLREDGKVPLLAAADTYRAAAIDQLRLWADRAGTDVVAHQPGADPGAVVYDAVQAALARRVDVVLVDTAGRLHTKSPLMEGLEPVRRVREYDVHTDTCVRLIRWRDVTSRERHVQYIADTV